MILCVAGNPSIDKLFEVERLTLGAIHRPLKFVQLPGGKGIHVAQVATKLGAEAVVTGVLGGYAGRWLAETLEAEKVHGRFVWSDGETRSSLSVADRETGQMTEFYEAGVPVENGAWNVLEKIVAELLPRASWLALAGSLPPGAPQAGYGSLIEAAHKLRVPVALDTRGEPLAHAMADRPEFIKINNLEAAELLGSPVDTPDQAQAAARQIRTTAGGDGHAAVVTLGKAGMAMAAADGANYRGSLPASGTYPVGSGDALLAGMLVALERGDAWSEAAALGLGAAAANVETPGAASLDPARAAELAKRAQVELSG